MSRRRKIEFLLVTIPFLLIIISFIIIVIKGHINLGDVNFDKLGGYGGFIGGLVGTYLTLIATFYVYKTYHSQKKELKSQKKELTIQRKLIAQQQFESTFFNMINVHRELKNGLRFKEIFLGGKDGVNSFTYEGLEVINIVNKNLRKIYSDIEKEEIKEEGEEFDYNRILKLSFEKLFKNHQNQISHYCRNVFHILKYIRENEINKKLGNDYNTYKNYANIFQSQLNVDEQFLLFYNFIHFNQETENENFWTINLVNHYKFLENIGIENLILKQDELYYDFLIKGSDRVI